MPVPPDKLAQQFRSAVLAGEHAAAERFVVQYSEALREMWVALPQPERAASPIPQQAKELLEWAREVTVVQRALTREHLAILDKACRYQPSAWMDSAPRAIEVQI